MLYSDDLLKKLVDKTLSDNTADGSFGTAVAVEFKGRMKTFFIKQQGVGLIAANSFGDRYKEHMFSIFNGTDGICDSIFAHKLTDDLTRKITSGVIEAYARYWEA